MADVLRVLDFGSASALRSQTLWHAVARGVSGGSPPTLSFVRPSEPYVCLGYHRRLDEVDLSACRRRKLPVYRRMVGGGPVYLDPDQLFFQISLPASALPARRREALRLLLEPAVAAWRELGVPARLDEQGEIVVGDRKICGHGAGQIDEAVTVVGNLIERFDHEAAVDVLRVPSGEARQVLLGLVRRYVAATPCDPTAFRQAATAAYAGALGRVARSGSLTGGERVALAQLDRDFEDPAWREGPELPGRPAWQAKIRAGVWVFEASDGCSRVVAGVVHGRLEGVRLFDSELGASPAALARTLSGLGLEEAAEVLSGLGAPGRRLARALSKVDGRLM